MKTVDRVDLIQIRDGEIIITIKKEQNISKYKQILNQLFDTKGEINMIDDYKVKVIDDMLSRIKQEECYCAKLTAGGSHTIDIDITALNLLKDYFSGNLEYTPATTFTTDVRKMTTTQLFNYIHDEHKEEFAPDGNSSWLIKFCEVSGISRAEAEACYWRNEPIKENPDANRKVIEYMQAEGII